MTVGFNGMKRAGVFASALAPWLFVGSNPASGEAQRLLSEAKIEVRILYVNHADGLPVLIDSGARYDGLPYIREFIRLYSFTTSFHADWTHR